MDEIKKEQKKKKQLTARTVIINLDYKLAKLNGILNDFYSKVLQFMLLRNMDHGCHDTNTDTDTCTHL